MVVKFKIEVVANNVQSCSFGTQGSRQSRKISFCAATLADIGLKGITKVFDRKMAYFILESIEEALKNTEITHILVHCSAGISRSAAVSRILNDFVNSVLSENETDWEYNDKHGFELPPTPNPHILATMRNVLYDEFL